MKQIFVSMKSFLILLVLCPFSYATVLSSDGAAVVEEKRDGMSKCLKERGLTIDDFEPLRKANLSDEVPIKDKNSEDRASCALACSFQQINKNGNIVAYLRNVISNGITKGAPSTEILMREMLETLNKCDAEAKGDNCKLLQCIQVTRDNQFRAYMYSYFLSGLMLKKNDQKFISFK